METQITMKTKNNMFFKARIFKNMSQASLYHVQPNVTKTNGKYKPKAKSKNISHRQKGYSLYFFIVSYSVLWSLRGKQPT